MGLALIQLYGARRSVIAKPADTNEADLHTATENGETVAAMWVANNTSGAIAATIQYYDGTTDWDIISAKDVPANDTIYISDIMLPMRMDDKIKITSETGNALTFGLILVEPLGGSAELPDYHMQQQGPQLVNPRGGIRGRERADRWSNTKPVGDR